MSLLALGPLLALDNATLRDLHARLNAAGLTPALFAEAAGIVPGLLSSTRNAAIRRVLASWATPGADLVRLFAYDDVLAAERCDELLGAPVCDALRAAGMLVGDDHALRARILVSPMADGIQILSDHLTDGTELAMGPGAGTAFLAGLIPRDAGPFLDLGCGAGSLAIVAAMRGARPVVGTDINPRAIEYARINARLNGVEIEWLRGDIARPVRDRRFDCVVSHPPFVARPRDGAQLVFLHGGNDGDELAKRVLHEVPELLSEGGRLMMLFVTPIREGALVARLHECVGATPCDVVALRLPGASAAQQAVTFASFECPDVGASFDAAVERLLRHLEGVAPKGVEGVLAVVARHGAETHRGRLGVALPYNGSDLAPDEIDALLERLAFVHEPDDALRALRVRVHPAMRWVTERPGVAPGEGGTHRVEFAPGTVAVAETQSTEHLAWLRALDAAPSVDRALSVIARDRRAVPAAVRVEALAFVRQALTRGHLVVARERSIAPG